MLKGKIPVDYDHCLRDMSAIKMKIIDTYLSVCLKELPKDENELQKRLEEQKKKREMIIKMKEQRRQALADQRRQNLVQGN